MQVPNHPTITTNGVLRPTQVSVDLDRISKNFHKIPPTAVRRQFRDASQKALPSGLAPCLTFWRATSTRQSDHLVRIVTVPVGYGDGDFRSMSGKAEVLIRGKRYPTVGWICMDQEMVNIEWETAYNNNKVVLIGNQEGEQITCEDLARWAGTIPCEILTKITTRVPRVYLPITPPENQINDR